MCVFHLVLLQNLKERESAFVTKGTASVSIGYGRLIMLFTKDPEQGSPFRKLYLLLQTTRREQSTYTNIALFNTGLFNTGYTGKSTLLLLLIRSHWRKSSASRNMYSFSRCVFRFTGAACTWMLASAANVIPADCRLLLKGLFRMAALLK